MRISISGTHSTGKTCLLNSCYEKMIRLYPFKIRKIDEVARKVISKGFPLNQDATVESYIHYIYFQMEEERNAITEHVISDRSLVDLLAYIRVNSDKRIPNSFQKMLEEILWVESKFFNLYCYLPIEFPLLIDDVRPVDEIYRKLVDKMIRSILKEYKLNFVEISGTIENRTNQLVELFVQQKA
jgi:nicotinamide riboside kinase